MFRWTNDVSWKSFVVVYLSATYLIRLLFLRELSDIGELIEAKIALIDGELSLWCRTDCYDWTRCDHAAEIAQSSFVLSIYSIWIVMIIGYNHPSLRSS